MTKAKTTILILTVILISVITSVATVLAVTPTKSEISADTNEAIILTETDTIPDPSVQSGYSVSDIAEICGESVVNIMVKGETTTYSGGSKQTKSFESSGTGVIIRQEGYIVTCQHVIDGAKEITVILDDESEYEAQVIGEVANFDMAVIKVDAIELPAADIGDSDTLLVGEEVVVIGNPLGEFGGSVSAGVLSAKGREVTIEDTPLRLLQTDAAVNPGNSGGGMFSSQGKLIGMVNAKVSSEGIEGIGFAIPINSIISKVESLINTGEVDDKVALGVSTRTTEYRIKGTSRKIDCLEVVSVKEGGSADTAGVKEGDLLVSLDGEKLKDNDTLTIAVKYAKPGDEVELELYRDDELITLKVILQKA